MEDGSYKFIKATGKALGKMTHQTAHLTVTDRKRS
jgi:hypothetical protein